MAGVHELRMLEIMIPRGRRSCGQQEPLDQSGRMDLCEFRVAHIPHYDVLGQLKEYIIDGFYPVYYVL